MSVVPYTRTLLTLDTRTGDAVAVGGVTVTPQARVLTLRLPFATLVWNRPVALLVRQHGRSTTLPIRDVPLLAQGALLGGAALAVLLGRLLAAREKATAR